MNKPAVNFAFTGGFDTGISLAWQGSVLQACVSRTDKLSISAAPLGTRGEESWLLEPKWDQEEQEPPPPTPGEPTEDI